MLGSKVLGSDTHSVSLTLFFHFLDGSDEVGGRVISDLDMLSVSEGPGEGRVRIAFLALHFTATSHVTLPQTYH